MTISRLSFKCIVQSIDSNFCKHSTHILWTVGSEFDMWCSSTISMYLIHDSFKSIAWNLFKLCNWSLKCFIFKKTWNQSIKPQFTSTIHHYTNSNVVDDKISKKAWVSDCLVWKLIFDQSFQRLSHDISVVLDMDDPHIQCYLLIHSSLVGCRKLLLNVFSSFSLNQHSNQHSFHATTKHAPIV